MDPVSERRLRDEVIFLHALWYQGPPRPNAAISSAAHYHLQPPKPLHVIPSSPEWPRPATPPPATSWPAAAGPTPKPPPLSAEEQSKLAGKYAHQHAVKAVRKFFVGNNADGCNDIDSSEDEDGDQMDEDCCEEEIDFFSKLFEDSALREYYQKNFVVGEFGCLVCGALGGKKTGKKYKGCLPLVQHSIAIGKTKKRRAHRAFAQAVCKVLGWEIHRLPEIVSMLSGNGNGERLVASVENVGSVKDGAVDGKDDGAIQRPADGDNLEDIHVEESASEGLTTNFLASPDADKTGNEVCPRAIATTTSTLASAPVTCDHLHPSSTTQFKKKKKKKKKKKGKKSKCKSETKLTNNAATESNSSLGAEQPCPNPLDMPSTSGWPTTGWATLEKPSLEPHLVSTEEQLIFAGKHAHQHALKFVHEFFRIDDSDEIDSDSDDEDDDDDEDEFVGEDGESEEISFFIKVFEEDTKLREYYMKNFAEGEFICLICGAMGGKKTGKKFKGCLPLMQHLTTIAKTKKRKAHRAFGRAVCKVLGWDIDCLPAVESMLSDKTGDTQNSLACPGNNENLSMVHQVEQPASEGSNIVTLNEELSREE